MLSNMSIMTTAVLFRLVLRRPVSPVQWASLVSLLGATLIVGTASTHSDGHQMPQWHMSPGYLFVLAQWCVRVCDVTYVCDA